MVKKLPVGVYVVSGVFEGLKGEVEFSFQGQTYSAQVGENAFSLIFFQMQRLIKMR